MHGKNSRWRPFASYFLPRAMSPGTSVTSHSRATFTTRTTLPANCSNETSSPALVLACRSVKSAMRGFARVARGRRAPTSWPPRRFIGVLQLWSLGHVTSSMPFLLPRIASCMTRIRLQLYWGVFNCHNLTIVLGRGTLHPAGPARSRRLPNLSVGPGQLKTHGADPCGCSSLKRCCHPQNCRPLSDL